MNSIWCPDGKILSVNQSESFLLHKGCSKASKVTEDGHRLGTKVNDLDDDDDDRTFEMHVNEADKFCKSK